MFLPFLLLLISALLLFFPPPLVDPPLCLHLLLLYYVQEWLTLHPVHVFSMQNAAHLSQDLKVLILLVVQVPAVLDQVLVHVHLLANSVHAFAQEEVFLVPVVFRVRLLVLQELLNYGLFD